MTNEEMKSMLDDLGVAYPKDAKHAELEALCAASSPSEGGAAADVATQPQELPEGPEAPVLQVACGRLNLRDEPGGAIVGEARRGSRVDALEERDGWILVHMTDDVWVRSEFLE